MKEVVYKLDRAVVTIMTRITEESMVDLVAEIDRLSTDYFYKTIELSISSPGGAALALDYYLDAIKRFRQHGVQIRTRALTQACSAAAAIVSLGDGLREAGSTTALRYHFHRIRSEEELTAHEAREFHRFLSQTDHKMTWQIAERAYKGYRSDGEAPEPTRQRERSLSAFSEMDWRIMNRLTGSRINKDFDINDEERKSCLAAVRERVAKDCEQQTDAFGFLRLYEEIFAIDSVMSGALACELRLIDGLVDDNETCPAAKESLPSANAVQIPEWQSIFSPGGQIARADLCRHVIVFGETGSGKTASAIVPVLRAILRQAERSYKGNSRVSCALVIDPKKELLPILNNGAAEGASVRVLKTSGNQGGLKLNLMSGEWSIQEDLAANDMLGAAHKILRRCASFSPENSAFQTVLGRGASDNSYWKGQGVRLAQTTIALLLTLLKFRAVIFDPQNLNDLAPYAKAKLRAFGVAAGLLAPQAEQAGEAFADLAMTLDSYDDDLDEEDSWAWNSKRFLFHTEARGELRKCWKDFVDGICGGPRKNPALRKQISAKSREFSKLLMSRKSPYAFQVIDKLKAVAESCWDYACPVLPDESIRPCRNLMVLASIFQMSFFIAGSGSDFNEPDRPARGTDSASRASRVRAKRRRKSFFLAHHLVEEYLRQRVSKAQGINDVFEEVKYFHSISATKNDTQHYTGIFAFAKPAFLDFSDSGPAHALFFGCEPFLATKKAAARGKEDVNLFADKINSEDGGTVYVYQPSLGFGHDTLIARALKAVFFETVLSDKKRQNNGADMPLVAYVADEFHRFITSDLVHGEQSFFDTCRSFGAFCVVASQSMSSLHHALAADYFTNKDEKAVEILLNNTGTKLFFRTTDRTLHELIDRLCPLTPGLPKATQVRPPSSLRPGECYAAVTDGRFLRSKIDLNAKIQQRAKTDMQENKVPPERQFAVEGLTNVRMEAREASALSGSDLPEHFQRRAGRRWPSPCGHRHR